MLQPLDRVPFRTLKRSWNEEIRLYTRSVAGAKLEKKYFLKIFSPVWQKSLIVDLAQAGFRASGLFPVNRRVIPDGALAPSAVTDRDKSVTAQKSTETSSQEIVQYDIPRSTLKNKRKGKHTMKYGGRTAMSEEEEETFAKYRVTMSDRQHFYRCYPYCCYFSVLLIN